MPLWRSCGSGTPYCRRAYLPQDRPPCLPPRSRRFWRRFCGAPGWLRRRSFFCAADRGRTSLRFSHREGILRPTRSRQGLRSLVPFSTGTSVAEKPGLIVLSLMPPTVVGFHATEPFQFPWLEVSSRASSPLPFSFCRHYTIYLRSAATRRGDMWLKFRIPSFQHFFFLQNPNIGVPKRCQFRANAFSALFWHACRFLSGLESPLF